MLNVQKVSVIGLGAMGAALAQGFIRGGFNVTVWNRTAARMEALVKEGALAATNAAAAVAASPLIVICTIDKSAAAAVLQQADVALVAPRQDHLEPQYGKRGRGPSYF